MDIESVDKSGWPHLPDKYFVAPPRNPKFDKEPAPKPAAKPAPKRKGRGRGRRGNTAWWDDWSGQWDGWTWSGSAAYQQTDWNAHF